MGLSESTLFIEKSAPVHHHEDTVMIAVDGSKESEYAFRWYVDHLHKQENRVWVCYVTPQDTASKYHSPEKAIPPEHESENFQMAEEARIDVTTAYMERMQHYKIRGDVYTGTGRPGPHMIQAADTLGATMIVMGTRGLGVLRRAVLGSVSQYVVQNSSIPVVVIPHPENTTTKWF